MVTTRQGTLADVEGISRLEHQNKSSWSHQQVTEELQRKISRVLVAEKTGPLEDQERPSLVGWIVAWYIPPFELQIIQVSVSGNYRRQGVGCRLLADMLAKFKHCEQVVLEVREDNIPAIELYQKIGFVQYGNRKNYYKDGTSAWLMKKDMP